MRTRTRAVRTASPNRRAPGRARSAALLAGALAAVLTGCSGAPAPPAAPAPAAASPAPQAANAPVADLPKADTFGNLDGAVPDPSPHGTTNGEVLRVEQAVPVRSAPDGAAFAELPATQLGNPTWVPVIARNGDWAQVLLPARPNGATGWIRAGAADPVQAARSPYVVEVDVDARRLKLLRDGQQVGSWTVGVGATESPTPRGRTYVMGAIRETVTRFSPIILPLGTHSQTYSSYGGGPGTVALHGWPNPDVFGEASSDGCVRVPADALNVLKTLPLGSLVLLR